VAKRRLWAGIANRHLIISRREILQEGRVWLKESNSRAVREPADPQPPGAEFFDAETNAPNIFIQTHERTQRPNRRIEWPEIPAKTPNLAS